MDKRSEIACNRFQLNAPLIDKDATQDPGERREMGQKITVDAGLSEKTIYRYLRQFTDKKLEGVREKRLGPAR
jgi:hypothetical protein